jgi:hypothetical protein
VRSAIDHHTLPGERERKREDVRPLAIELQDGGAELTEDVVYAVLADKVVWSDGGEVVVGIGRVEEGDDPEPGLAVREEEGWRGGERIVRESAG